MTDGYTYFGKKTFDLPKIGVVWEDRIFPRDIMLSSLILRDYNLMENIARFCTLTQGKKNDPTTGEEPGKIIHEIDPSTKKAPVMRGRQTMYNASDNTLLFLIILEKLGHYHPYILDEFARPAMRAAAYINRHTKNGLYFETPHFCGARRFALRVTYWKDSELPVVREPKYPVSYFLLQAQFIECVRSAQFVFDRLGMKNRIRTTDMEAVAALYNFWDGKDFSFAIDSGVSLVGVNSDTLHALYYLQNGDLEKQQLRRIGKYSELLRTPFGFRTYAPNQEDYYFKKYHLGSIWPFEQYFISKGAYRHKLRQIGDTAWFALQEIQKLGAYPEILYYNRGKVEMAGSAEQLWTYSAIKAMLGEKNVLDFVSDSVSNGIRRLIPRPK